MRRWFGVGLASLLLAIPACRTPSVALSDLPDAPIALMYWEPEPARRRAEVLAGVRNQSRSRRGVARLEDLGELLGAQPRRAGPAAELARWPGGLRLLDPRTGRLERVDAATPGSRPMAWSQDHRRLLYASARLTGRPQLFEVDFDKREVRTLTRGPESHPRGDYGPRDRLLYSGIELTGMSGVGRLYVSESDSAGPRLLSQGGLYESPRWSPDGRTVVFARIDSRAAAGRGSGRGGMVLVSRSLTPDAAERVLARGKQPVFSPDGEWIVYCAPGPEGWRLWRMRPDGSGRTPLGKGAHDERSPAVSPDGRFVAFIAEESGLDRLFVRRMDGSGDRILLGDGAVAWPVW